MKQSQNDPKFMSSELPENKKKSTGSTKPCEEIIAEPNLTNLVKTINLQIEDKQASKRVNPKNICQDTS